jgi:hypothetical protein
MPDLQKQRPGQRVYLNTNQCAELILRTPGSVRRLAAMGKIPFRKVSGRLMFPLDEIEKWINSGPGKTIDGINCR